MKIFETFRWSRRAFGGWGFDCADSSPPLLSQLGQHKEALSLLALSLRDANSSEAYCSQSGAVLSPMLAEAVAQDHGLKMYATLVSRGGKATLSKNKLEQETPQENGSGLKITADEKQKLLKTLLQVYMENGKE